MTPSLISASAAVAALVWLTTLLIRIRKQGSLKNLENRFFCATTFSFLTVLFTVYLSSPGVNSYALGGPDDFSAFGSMLGGILSPIFGFLTVLLLLATLKIQKVEYEDKEYRRFKSEIEETILDALKIHDKLLTEEAFQTNRGIHFSLDWNPTTVNEAIDKGQVIHQYSEYVRKFPDPNTWQKNGEGDVFLQINTLQIMAQFRLIVAELAELYRDLINPDDIPQASLRKLRRLDYFLSRARIYQGLSLEEYHEHLKKAIKKLGRTPEGFIRTYEPSMYELKKGIAAEATPAKK